MSLEVKIIERKRYGNISREVHLNGLLLTTNSYMSLDALVESLNLKLISSEITDKGYTDYDLIMYFTQKEV